MPTKENLELLSLINSLIKEASNAPNLFSDLSKVEQYIAESYKSRSFIELIQNADDARSSKVGVYSTTDGIIVLNNGRPFNLQDIEALCRSGASNKQRGGNTIGYRGIGFKSVINLSKTIFLLSNSYCLCFDKNLTRKIFSEKVNDVPLIRIPHLVEPDTIPDYQLVKELLKSDHYNTAFIFSHVNERGIIEEFLSFDNTSLLFLRNIVEVNIYINKNNREIKIEKLKQDASSSITLYENKEQNKWRTFFKSDSLMNAVALKVENNRIVPASDKESVIHSFTPTYEFSGAYLKINGDYSTDPSRKNIDFDSESEHAFDSSVSQIGNIIISIINGDASYPGFFSPFINVKNLENSKFKGLLRKKLGNYLKTQICNVKENDYELTSLRLFPSWINYEDYEEICCNKYAYIKGDIYKENPEILTVLDEIGFQTLSLNEIIERVNDVHLSIIGMAQITCKIIKQLLYEMSDNLLKTIISLCIFPVNNSFCASSDVKDYSRIDPEFMAYLTNNIDSSDLKLFFKKLSIRLELSQDLHCNSNTNSPKNRDTIDNYNPLKNRDSLDISNSRLMNSELKPKFSMQKWRSAEQNALEYIQSLPEIVSIRDISKANLGYDLEAITSAGKTLYIEVKSVKTIGEKIRLTNNEYSSAHHYNSNYYLAIVRIDSVFEIFFIQDPIKSLLFQKQCENWVWLCDEYDSLLNKEIASLPERGLN